MTDDFIEGPILVTGGAGYIGGQTVLCLLDLGVETIVLDDLSTGRIHPFHDKTKFYEGKVHDQLLVEDILRRHKINSILHFAGSIKVDESIADPLKYYDNNTDGSRRLIAAAVNTDVKRFIFSSTAAVYGNVVGNKQVSEDAIVSPLNPYGWSKLFTEKTLQDVAQAHGLQYGILRYFNVAGADPALRHGQYLENPVHLIGRAIDAMRGKGGPLRIFGENLPTPDGTGVRDYIHVSDLAEAHLAALRHLSHSPDSLLVNLGYGTGSSVLEVVRCLEQVSGKAVPHEFVASREGEAASVVADISRLGNTLKWQPKFNNIEEIVRSALAWTRQIG
jgi:UDP-glucose 4-epimerase